MEASTGREAMTQLRKFTAQHGLVCISLAPERMCEHQLPAARGCLGSALRRPVAVAAWCCCCSVAMGANGKDSLIALCWEAARLRGQYCAAPHSARHVLGPT